MAGSPGVPTAPDPNPFRKEKPRVTTFSCGKCGAPVSVRYPGHSLSAACESCGSVIDTSNDAFRVINTYYMQVVVKPRIELGSRGTINGKTWEVIGFVVRRDLASSFKWEEYLLFNPFYGYRFLTCNNGHWSLVTMMKRRPVGSVSRVEFDNEQYKLFYQGRAEVVFVLGEFYWQVAVGETVEMKDYVAPPKMLSSEKDGHQIVWSMSEYLPPETVKAAFENSAPSISIPVGVAPNQPSPVGEVWKKVSRTWMIFLFVLTLLEMGHWMTALNKIEFQQPFPYTQKSPSIFSSDANKTESITSPVFELSKDNANVEIDLDGNVDNSWLYIYGELVNDDTAETFTFERTIEYYHGYDGGEAWSEGGRSQKVFMPSVPGGKYYLNLDVDNGGSNVGGRNSFVVKIRRDVGTWHNYLWCLFLLSIYPIIIWLQSRSVEVARWSDSDYSPYRGSDD